MVLAITLNRTRIYTFVFKSILVFLIQKIWGNYLDSINRFPILNMINNQGFLFSFLYSTWAIIGFR